MIQRIKRKVEENLKKPKIETNDDDREKKTTICWRFPYVQGKDKFLREKIHQLNRNLPENLAINPVFQVNKTSMFFHNKDRIPRDLKSNCVYKYTCGDCNKVYIGETSRHLITRAKEHIKGYPVPTEITTHCHDTHENNFSVIAVTKWHRILETICLKETKNLINEREGSIPLILHL